MAQVVAVRVKAPTNLVALSKKLKEIDRTLAQGVALKRFAPELNRALIETSAGAGAFTRGWIVRLLPEGAGMQIGNTFGKSKFVELPTKPHLIKAKPGFKTITLKSGKTKRVPNTLAWRANGKGAFSAFKVNASTKAGAYVHALVVHHPGTRGKFAFKRTMQAQAGRLFSLLFDEFSKALKG